MRKIHHQHIGSWEESRRPESSPPPADGRGVVHCFVGTEELRGLLSVMAGTELLNQLIKTIVASARKSGLPPAPL